MANDKNYKGKKGCQRKPRYNNKDKRDDRDERDQRQSRNGREKDNKAVEPVNNPKWYYFDAKQADAVTAMAFQNLAGYPINYDGKDLDVPNIVRIEFNPCPGVTPQSKFGTAEAQETGLNNAALNWYIQLSATTGRVQAYASQDVGIALLAYGEIISQVEWLRRAFGVSYVTSGRNRDYPRDILNYGMLIDPDDFFQHRSNYMTQFNELLTLVGSLRFPKNVAYFDKCASMYEKIFMDYPSEMAQTLITNPWTTWELDETTFSGGGILHTVSWHENVNTAQPFSFYLAKTKSCLFKLLNSSVTTKVYTDMMNYALKYSLDWWKFDMLEDSYRVEPVYSPLFMLQMHNATIAGVPNVETQYINTSSSHVTPLNDVYVDPNTNSIYYNPAFRTANGQAGGPPRTGNTIIVDMMSDTPTIDERCDVTRYMSISNGTAYQPTGQSTAICYVDTTLPDHYVVGVYFKVQTNNLNVSYASGTLTPAVNFGAISTLAANIDWAPRFLEFDSSGNLTGRYTGDINYYTTIDRVYLEKIHNFVTLALYAVRSQAI